MKSDPLFDPQSASDFVTECTADDASTLLDEDDGAAFYDDPELSAFRSFWRRCGYLLACFLIPAGIMLLMHFGIGVYPFGEESILVLDMNGQYVYYFEALRDLILGDGSFLYSFGRTLGGEFMGIFAYYLASPLSFLVALFPDNMITEALLTILVLKTGLSGLTFGIYIHKTRKRNPVPTVIFSIMYALTAYGVVYQHNTMWLDNVIWLPLILLGIENMIKYGKFKLFVISLSFAVLSNFYIGYMTCIFVAVYFFYAYYSRTPEERNPLGVSRHFLKSFARIVFFSVIVIAISSIIILPAYYSLTFGKTTFSDPSYTIDAKFDLLDALSMMYFGSYDTVRPEGLPLLYSGMLTFLLVPLYFFVPHVRTREKIASGVLVVFFLFSFNTVAIDLVWHGFQRPNWLNYRYSFILCFMMILFAYKAFEKIREIGYRYVIGSVTGISLLLLILQKLEYENIRDFGSVWASLFFLGAYLCILRASSQRDPESRRTASLVLAIVVSLEAFCAGFMNLRLLDEDVVISSRTGYRTFMDRIQPVVDKLEAEDDTFYRMEKLPFKKVNDNLALRINGLSNSTSTLNADVIKMLNKFGLASKSHWTKYMGGTPVLDSLMSLKYLIAETDDPVSPLYTELFVENDDLIAYQNPYALSLAFGVDPSLADFDFYDETCRSPFERMNALLTAMLGSDEKVTVFEEVETDDVSFKNCKVSLVTGHKKYAPESSDSKAKITFELVAPDDGLIYCYFPSDYPREVDVYVNGVDVGTFFGNETFSIKTLGPFEAGEDVNVQITLKKDDLYLASGESFFYTLNETAFEEAMSSLSESQFAIDYYEDDAFYGKLNVKDGQNLIYTSIPYDEGWVVKVDGVETQTVKLMGALMGFTVPSVGEHTLSLEYKPDCVKYGSILSISGVSVFFVACIADTLYNRKKRKEEEI